MVFIGGEMVPWSNSSMLSGRVGGSGVSYAETPVKGLLPYSEVFR